MTKFRKKPIVVDALQYTGANFKEIQRFTEFKAEKPGGKDDHFIISTLEGDLYASTGDWIIKGIQGEFYPCKSDIFEKTYEPQEQEPNIDIAEMSFNEHFEKQVPAFDNNCKADDDFVKLYNEPAKDIIGFDILKYHGDIAAKKTIAALKERSY